MIDLILFLLLRHKAVDQVADGGEQAARQGVFEAGDLVATVHRIVVSDDLQIIFMKRRNLFIPSTAAVAFVLCV